MQITQELCKRPGLNRAGFEMQTIYIPTLLDKVKQKHLLTAIPSVIGPLQLTVTWYRICHAGEQATHWDIQNKENSSLTG